MTIKRGDFIEFTDEWYINYPPPDKSKIKFGIAIEDTDSLDNVKVRTVEGIETAKCIHAYAWAGWIPEELEEIYNKEFNDDGEAWDIDW